MMTQSDTPRILLGVSGGIAAYKSCEIVRRLRDAGCTVRVVLTEAATTFVTPLTFQALSGQPVRTTLLDAEAESGMDHIALARWADQILIAPATADVMARLAHGLADDLLSTICLASQAPVTLAPAMNQGMWSHLATQANLDLLQQRGVRCIGPESGSQACGETGMGRMSDPEVIVAGLLDNHQQDWAGERVLISAGPTYEAIDPVRFIGNRSSGRMGFALAAAARARGASVCLVHGPVALQPPPGVVRIAVESALAMREAVLFEAARSDVFISAAAVADYRPASIATEKIKKRAAELSVELVRNPDIVSEVASQPAAPFTVGFAAETEHVSEYARAKMERKGLDMIAANDVSAGQAIGQASSALHVLWPGGGQHLPLQPKDALAHALLDLIVQRRHQPPKHKA